MLVSVVRFMEESEDMSEDLTDLAEDRSEVERGELGTSPSNSAKYGWARAWLAVIRLLGSKCSIFCKHGGELGQTVLWDYLEPS